MLRYIGIDGQTSAGKTHTMEGPSLRTAVTTNDGKLHSSAGVIPRSVEKLFKMMADAQAKEREQCVPGSTNVTMTDYSVVVSYFEICKYMSLSYLPYI